MKDVPSKNEFLNYLISRIRERKVSFFLGAGISKNSGLPLAKELENHLSTKLCNDLQLSDSYEEYFHSLNLPFESFIQILVDYPKGFFDSFIEIHKLGKPNENHFLISNLIKDGYVSELLTTNFDVLLEDALRAGHTIFDVIANEKQFSELDPEKSVSPVIYKIHGSIDNPNSMRFTLEMIAQRTLLQSRLKILSYFFNRADRDVVFLGYSCSDEFDINILLKSMKSPIRILYFKHSNDPKFIIEPLRYPFEEYDGYQIVCNTDEIIRMLSTEFGYSAPISSSPEHWRIIVNQWCTSLNKSTKYYFLGFILSDMAETKGSKLLLEKGLENANDYERGCIENTLVRVALMESDYDSAITHIQVSLAIFEKLNEKMRVAESSFRLGQIEKRIGNYKEAGKYYHESLKMCKDIDYGLGIDRALIEIGMLLRRTGNLNEAEEKFTESLSISEEIGDLNGLSSNLHELGKVKRIKGDFDDAEKYLRRALEISTKMGNKGDIASSKGELALVLEEKNDFPSADILLNECLKLFEEIPDLYGISHALHEIGNLFFRKGEYTNAEQFYWKALKKKQEISDKEGIANVYGQIGNIRMLQGKKAEAKEYFTKCYVTYKELNNEQGMSLAKRCLDML